MNKAEKNTERKIENTDLKKVCEIAKEKGYKVYTFQSKHSNTIEQIFFVNQKNQIGSASTHYGGIRFSTMHKPTRGIGTGFGSLTKEDFNSPEDLDIAFMHSPNWARAENRQAVKKWNNWKEYTSKESILKYYEL